MVREEEDLHFEGMEEEKGDLWVDNSCIFYDDEDDFPPLPDFGCMSNINSVSSSSENENLNLVGCMDLIDTNEIWDPSSVFEQELVQGQQKPPEDDDAAAAASGFSFLHGNSELSVIFLEWLKQNRDYISAEDMRSIKLKRSTIESASKRLGTTSEGKKQLLKLILEWVEQYQLQKNPTPSPPFQITNPNPNPNFVYNLPADLTTTVPPAAAAWMQPPAATMAYPTDPYSVVNGIPYPPAHSSSAAGMEHAQSWPAYQFSHFPPDHHQAAAPVYPYQMFDPPNGNGNGNGNVGVGERLGSSATKEARKKRMARQQRRLYSHHHHHHRHTSANSNQHLQNQLMNDPNDVDEAPDNNNWMCWSPRAAAAPSQPSSGDIDPAPTQQQNHQRNASSDRKQHQAWKTEKNLKFLLQKVLKQSDVGNLGRIVLPKKEAESHLPELESRDGISIAMEDIGTSRVWNMRYRFWPNNKSRMYLLENTGDFVRANGLQEGDFIVIYSDTKCGKYMIRGVKVRQPGMKLEGKKPARRNIRNLSLAGNSSSLAIIKQAAVR